MTFKAKKQAFQAAVGKKSEKASPIVAKKTVVDSVPRPLKLKRKK